MNARQSAAARPIVMVTGAFPPDICGVGDYTGRLMAAAPATWEVFVERDWSPRTASGIVRRLFARHPSAVVIQYPTQGYGWSLVPHLLVFMGWLTRRYRSTLALHEFSSLSGKARLALAVASHFAAHIIFTTEAEREQARSARWFSSKVSTTVIGILSNIPWAAKPPGFTERGIDLAYFGHIRPNKGLEDFLTVMAGFKAAEPARRVMLIGEIPTGYEDFADMVVERCRAIGIELSVGLDDVAVGRVLTDVKILYLPFRDGVSARRGSVLAGLGNGALIASRIGAATPSALLPVVIACDGDERDVATLLRALRHSAVEAAVLQEAGQNYIGAMLPRDWAHVVQLYDAAVMRALEQ